jgi:hypothetical protein
MHLASSPNALGTKRDAFGENRSFSGQSRSFSPNWSEVINYPGKKLLIFEDLSF